MATRVREGAGDDVELGQRQPACARPRSPRAGHCRAHSGSPVVVVLVHRSRLRARTARRAARPRSPPPRSRSISSPCGSWNSTPSSSGHSSRCMPDCGRCSCSRRAPDRRAQQRIASGVPCRNTSRPPGRSSRAASGSSGTGRTRCSRRTPRPRGRSSRRAAARPRRSPRRAGTRCRSRPCSGARCRAAPA